MKIHSKKVGTVDVLIPHGPLVDDDAESLIATLTEHAAAPNSRFVLDMEEVPYMDSRSIEGMVEVADELQKRGERLRLASVTPTCREILEITGQAQRVEFFNDTQTAVRSFL